MNLLSSLVDAVGGLAEPEEEPRGEEQQQECDDHERVGEGDDNVVEHESAGDDDGEEVARAEAVTPSENTHAAAPTGGAGGGGGVDVVEGGGAAAAGGGGGLWGLLRETSQSLVSDLSEFASALKEESREMLNDESSVFAPITAYSPAPPKKPTDGVRPEEDEELDDDGEEAQGPLSGALERVWGVVPSLFGGGVEDVLEEELEDELPDEEALLLEERRLRLLAMQQDNDTYVKDPEHDDFASFEQLFHSEYVETWLPRTFLVLQTQRVVQERFKMLVPVHVEEWRFWARYIFRVQTLDEEETRRERLLADQDPSEAGSERVAVDEPVAALTWDEDEEEEEEEEEEAKEIVEEEEVVMEAVAPEEQEAAPRASPLPAPSPGADTDSSWEQVGGSQDEATPAQAGDDDWVEWE